MRYQASRFIYMVVAGILISFLLQFLVPGKPVDDHIIFHYLTAIVITTLVWEGNLRLDTWLNRISPWIQGPVKRILLQVPISTIYSAVTIFALMLFFDSYVCKIPNTNKLALMITSVIIGVMVTFILLSIEIGAQFFGHWKRSLLEVEKYKTESVQAQLQNLKDQVNPHFLFNNLSVLSSLVYKDQDKAVDFINQLSKVYRYLLDTRNTELITLGDELTFMDSYIYLLHIRFDPNLRFTIEIPDPLKSTYLPPMALQMLIENAIKHNEVSGEQPLHIHITTTHDMLEIRNNLQLRSNNEKSSGTGLNNIKARYKYYTDKPVDVIRDDNSFTVRIPLIHQR